jgi:FkbH-like protein
MKLIEALELLRQVQPPLGRTFEVELVCGFTPLHLETFLKARLRQVLPDRRTAIHTGLYGDFWGNLDRVRKGGTNATVVVIEWGDLDPRLGLRSLGSWQPSVFSEILEDIESGFARLTEAVQKPARQAPLVISFPTLPLPPISFAPGWQASAFDLELRACAASAAAKIAHTENVKVLSPERLDRLSPPDNRFDAKSELASGFPYSLAHASTLAELISHMVAPATPKKGLITDLDDTLWNGILGEVGIDGVFWDLEHHGQVHGLYQRLLHGLSEAGILIAAASKNDPELVERALEKRGDLVLPHNALFPVEAHWGPKSESVGRILKTWNIGADSVVFVDDSPMELAEVKSAYPSIECILFPKDDPQALVGLFHRLRDMFGRGSLSEEDRIRQASIRRNHERTREFDSRGGNLENFLAQAEAELTLSFSKEPIDPRALELVNKTNQFNLNGRRFTEAEWQTYLLTPDTFLLITAYKDKYGPLGKIAVLAGRKRERTIFVDVWVMSCRAFSRRIEHRCIEELLKRFDAQEIVFDFIATPKNSPIREFLEQITGVKPEPKWRISRDQFKTPKSETFHRVLEVSNG